MKKILLAAGLLAVASLHTLSAGECGSFNLASITDLSYACTVTVSGVGTYTLTNWTLSQVSGTYNTPLAAGNINVNVVSTSNGFYVDYSGAVLGNGIDYFTLDGSGQQSNFKTGFWIMPTSGGPYGNVNSTAGIDSIVLSENNPNGTASFSVTKQMQDFTGANLASNMQVYYQGQAPGCSGSASDPACYILSTTNPTNTTLFNYRTAGMSIVDVVQFNAGTSGTGSITGYRNTFAVNTVPEPMTFVLMGAGLVGIAVLRRRNG